MSHLAQDDQRRVHSDAVNDDGSLQANDITAAHLSTAVAEVKAVLSSVDGKMGALVSASAGMSSNGDVSVADSQMPLILSGTTLSAFYHCTQRLLIRTALYFTSMPLGGVMQSVNSLVSGNFTSTIPPLTSNNVGVLAQLGSPSNFDFLGDLVRKVASASCSPYLAKGIIDDTMSQFQLLLQKIDECRLLLRMLSYINLFTGSLQANDTTASINANVGGLDDVSAADVAGVTAPLVNRRVDAQAVLSALGDALKVATPDNQFATVVFCGSCNSLGGFPKSVNTLAGGDFILMITSMIGKTLSIASALGGAGNFDFLGQFNVQDLSGSM
uniref:Uncharacterized protein n=1 Tax=Moniliophthora roreri TaxID=221103 RepID=A0A0W0F1C1_MONRR